MAIQSLAPGSLPVPEPDLQPEQLIARGEALQPRLRELQEETEQRGYLAESTHAAIVQAGICRTLQPRRFGGYEFDLPTFFRVMIALARGCPSTAWCMSLGSGHALPLASNYSEQAQREIFGPTGHFQAPHRPDAQGTARPVAGGYRITGTWDYCSGAPFATHLMAACRLLNPDGSLPDGPPTILQAVVPKGQFRMLDDWGHILGLRGSGSNTVVVDDAVIPEHWAVDFAAIDRTQETPGTRLHGNPMYLGYVGALYPGEVASVMVGTARAALDEYEQILRTKSINSMVDPTISIKRYQTLEGQRNFGRALALTDAAEGLLLRAGEQFMETCQRWRDEGVPFTLEDNQRLGAMV